MATKSLIGGHRLHTIRRVCVLETAAGAPSSFTSYCQPQPDMNPEDTLHFGFFGEPFLFANLRIDSFGSFIVAALITVVICFSERWVIHRMEPTGVTYPRLVALPVF